MHTGWHVAGGIVVGAVVKSVGLSEWGAIFMGMVAIDFIDHGIYGIVTIRPFTVDNILKTGMKKYREMEPGFYFFHLWEVFGLCLILLWNSHLGRYFMLAYLLHLLMDIFQYYRVLKSWEWMKYWTIMGWLR